jgi:hypothetical protein
MSPARDISDGTGATTKQDLTHDDQRPSKAKEVPTLEVPDDTIPITDEKHQPTSKSVSSDHHLQFSDKATHGAPSDTENPRSENLVSSVNKLDSLDDPAGTKSSSEATSRDAESTSSGKTSLIPISANSISSTDRDYAHGNTPASRGDSSQDDGKSEDISTSRLLKRKIAPTPTTEQLPKTHGTQHISKKMKSSNGLRPRAPRSILDLRQASRGPRQAQPQLKAMLRR